MDSTLACRPPLSCYEVELVLDQGQDHHHLGLSSLYLAWSHCCVEIFTILEFAFLAKIIPENVGNLTVPESCNSQHEPVRKTLMSLRCAEFSFEFGNILASWTRNCAKFNLLVMTLQNTLYIISKTINCNNTTRTYLSRVCRARSGYGPYSLETSKSAICYLPGVGTGLGTERAWAGLACYSIKWFVVSWS